MALNAVTTLVGLPGEFIKGSINTAISAVGNDNILEIAWNVFRRATQKAILTTVSVILKTTLSAMIGYLGPVDSIWKAIIDNPANQELFNTLKKDWWKVARFLVDLLEPMKRFVCAGSIDGTPPPEAVRWNDYNELDLTKPMNRHAALSQIQRFFKSIIEVFRQKNLNVGEFVMDTKLETDCTGPAEIVTVLKRENDKVKAAETWLFVNGIAGEFFWNHLAIQKIQDFFFDVDKNPEDKSDEIEARRTIINGVFNRSDGILWDLIECAGERRPELRVTTKLPNTSAKAPLSSRTASSRDAQKTLSDALRSALSESKVSGKDIIMIAHSQGCLLLRLALEEIFDEGEGYFQAVMQKHLHVYTFGNPAYDWDVHAYTASTEHFANELDYVAKLGVLRQYSSDRNAGVKNDLTYCSRCRARDKTHKPNQRIFVNNKNQSGHLFGSQYSLQVKDYDCVNGTGVSALLARAERRP
jgi:hypothetical protein